MSTQQYNEGFEHISESKAEADRLDGLNARMRDFFGGKLTVAPIELSKIKTVLELGAGSCAWTLDAATALPAANIIACDIDDKLPNIKLPHNVQFHTKVDVTQQLPYEAESFDFIHARLLFVHVQDAASVINRITLLLKPGGWLVIEEPDDLDFDEEGNPRGLAKHARVIAMQNEVFRQRGLDLAFGRRLENILKDTGVLDMVTALKLDMPFTGSSHDEKLLALGMTFRDGLLSLVSSGVTKGRFTQDLYDETKCVMDDEEKQPYGRLYLASGRKKLRS